jgi:c-di-GMP-binding flagellar brake protein YcgR
VKGPAIGQTVQVVAPSGASLDARVKGTGGGSFLLRFYTDPRELLAGRTVSLEFTNRRGVCRIPGSAESAAGESVLHVTATGTVELVQRRDFVRVEAFVPVSYKPDGPDGWTATGHTLDVSGGGFQLAAAEGLRLGDMRRFTLELGEGEDDLSAVAQAVRGSGDVAFGMRFVEILERDRQRLVRWVFARERLARQIARHP